MSLHHANTHCDQMIFLLLKKYTIKLTNPSTQKLLNLIPPMAPEAAG